MATKRILPSHLANLIKDTADIRDMPLDQMSWHRFLRSWSTAEIKEYTPTWAGFSSSPGGLISYVQFGPLVAVFTEQILTGTSDATTFTMSGMPDAIKPPTQRGAIFSALDNSTSTMARATLSNSGVFTFSIADTSGSTLTWNGSGWTASANKGITQGSIIVYSLYDVT